MKKFFFDSNLGKKSFLAFGLIVLMLIPVFAGPGKDSGSAQGKAVLTMGSWRADDVAQVNKLLAEYQKLNPDVQINYRPTNPHDYNSTLRLQLEGGTGPDLLYARSYATGQELFNAGFIYDCTSIPGLMSNFTKANLAPWQMADGKMFAVPFAAVSHAVYYNKTVFAKEGLSIPQTWEDFLKLCATLQAKGYTPLANGVADEWDTLECLFLPMLPNFIGGASERVKYESGEKKMNDANFVAAYKAVGDLAKYLPKGFEAVTYNDSQVLFNTQKAVMFFDGSWTMEVYKDATFDWGVFAVPAPAGRKAIVVFHPDMAITMNSKTKYPDQSKAFLAWLCTSEGATTASANLPLGFFPMINFPIKLTDAHANEFLALNNGKETDARFVWPKLMDLYAPMNQAVIKVLKGEMTPQQAANATEAARTK